MESPPQEKTWNRELFFCLGLVICAAIISLCVLVYFVMKPVVI